MDQYRVVPMRLFATWEADRTSSNCVPRLCTLTLSRLTVFKSLDTDLNCLVIAVKLQGYKRTLRSNDITVVPVNGIIDVDLDISFTLQYPHFIKKKNNSLLVMLQRRRRYKSRPIPGGFKTLAVGVVNLTEVLQSSNSMKELGLHSDLDDEELNTSVPYPNRRHQPATAKLYLHTLNSQPLEQDDAKTKEQQGEFTDEEEDDSTANDDGGSDSEHAHAGDELRPISARIKGRVASATSPSAVAPTRGRSGSRQKNFKQKVVALLKKFKISEEEVLKAVESAESQQPTEQEIRDLLEELDNYSNSDLEPDADTISVKSTPKPSLRPYFSSTTASRERLPTIENGGKDSEESKESGGDSQADMDTTDPEQPEPLIQNSSIGMINRPAPAVTRVPTSDTVAGPSSVHHVTGQPTKNGTGGGVGKELSKTPFSRPIAGRNSDKKKKLPGNRHASVEVGGTGSAEATRQISMLERLHAASASSSRLRSARDSTGFMFLTPLPHQSVNEQLSQILPADEANCVPDVVVLLSAFDVHSVNLAQALREKLTTKMAILSGQADVKALVGAVLNRIQKFCNTNVLQAQTPVKLVVLGADRFFAHCLKVYTELLAQKSNEWLHYLRIFFVGPTWSVVSRYLCQLDHAYSTIFSDNFWRDWWDKSELSQQDIFEIVTRVSRYLNNAKLLVQLPVAEAMLQLKDKGSSEEMSNIFVPFVVDVRRAAGENAGFSEPGPLESSPLTGPAQTSTNVSGSPPGGLVSPGVSSPRPASSTTTTSETGQTAFSPGHSSPPGSPHTVDRAGTSSSGGEAQELQIEYWTSQGGQGPPAAIGPSGSTHKRESGEKIVTTTSNSVSNSGGATGLATSGSSSSIPPTKYSLKTAFKSLIISRLPSNPSMLFGDLPSTPPSLIVQFIKEKKKDKVLQKLGMKNKEKIESEQKSQSIDGISRLICSAKQHATMKLYIDGVEWTNVKFFQISAQWQTHVKHMPIGLFHIDA